VTLEPPAVVPEPAGAIRCPRCQSPVAPDQDWCLECGAAARTRLAPTPNWRLPVAALALVALLAGIGLAVAFVALTDDNTKAKTASTAAPVVATEPTAAPPPTTPPTTTTPPTATTPGITTTTPTTTTPPATTTPATTTPPATTAPSGGKPAKPK
jgi:hypothetical protein